jgi:branched-chain amino acid transport system permease protein
VTARRRPASRQPLDRDLSGRHPSGRALGRSAAPAAAVGAVARRLRPTPSRVGWALGGLALVAAPWIVADYAVTLLTHALSFGLLAVSVALLAGVAGLPTLGQTAPYAAGAYTTALLVRDGSSLGIGQLSAAALAGALLAALTAPLVLRTRGVATLMITLALGELTATLAGRWKSLTGGTDGLTAFAPPHPFWGTSPLASDRAVYLYVLAVSGAVTIGLVALLRTPAGLLLRGCAEDEDRMRASGHPVTAYLGVAYVGAGAVAGLAGSLLVVADRYVSPADGDFTVAALALLAVVLGGAGSVGGALFGAARVVGVRDWLAAPLPGHAPLLLGALFVAAVYLLPTGLSGLARRVGRRSRTGPAHRLGLPDLVGLGRRLGIPDLSGLAHRFGLVRRPGPARRTSLPTRPDPTTPPTPTTGRATTGPSGAAKNKADEAADPARRALLTLFGGADPAGREGSPPA